MWTDAYLFFFFFFFWQAGYDYDEETFEKIFRRIYASFGSSAPYSVFPDSQPFLRWARGEGLLVGLVSNAEYRYQDVILPALGLEQVNRMLSWQQKKKKMIVMVLICYYSPTIFNFRLHPVSCCLLNCTKDHCESYSMHACVCSSFVLPKPTHAFMHCPCRDQEI